MKNLTSRAGSVISAVVVVVVVVVVLGVMSPLLAKSAAAVAATTTTTTIATMRRATATALASTWPSYRAERWKRDSISTPVCAFTYLAPSFILESKTTTTTTTWTAAARARFSSLFPGLISDRCVRLFSSSPSSLSPSSLSPSSLRSYSPYSSSSDLDHDHDHDDNDYYDDKVEAALLASGYTRPIVNWYPGHIAKAERLLSETLKSVDVVIEVRDARCPKATAHPRVGEWSAGRPRVVVLTHADAVTPNSRGMWKRAYEAFGAGRWDADVGGQVRNAALQAWSERRRWKSPAVGGKRKGSGGNIDGDRGAVFVKNNNNHKYGDVASQVEEVLFVDAKRGAGVRSIHRAVLRAGAHVNERRLRRGLNERPLRVGVIGYPNVGKSALINKILGRRRARTANTPGVTRSLQWIRVRTDDNKKSRGKEFELLDSPGIIPAHMVDQSDALLLAACNSIGDAAYDNQAVAAYLCEWIKTLHIMGQGETTAPRWREECRKRYGFDPLEPQPVPTAGGPFIDGGGGGTTETRLPTGEDMLFLVADNCCRGSPEDAARKILQDFRSGRMGPVALQLAPRRKEDEGQTAVDVRRGVAESLGGDLFERATRSAKERQREEMRERDRRARAAMETARERGLELPPVVDGRSAGGTVEGEPVETSSDVKDSSSSVSKDEIGKGMFDGW